MPLESLSQMPELLRFYAKLQSHWTKVFRWKQIFAQITKMASYLFWTWTFLLPQAKLNLVSFAKKMTSPYCILYRSAISQKTKRDSLFQDGIRRLRNMSPGIGLVERRNVLSSYMNTLKISGYDQKFRFTLLKGILDREKVNNAEILSGARTKYRCHSQIMSMKASRLGKHNSTWFLRMRVPIVLNTLHTW